MGSFEAVCVSPGFSGTVAETMGEFLAEGGVGPSLVGTVRVVGAVDAVVGATGVGGDFSTAIGGHDVTGCCTGDGFYETIGVGGAHETATADRVGSGAPEGIGGGVEETGITSSICVGGLETEGVHLFHDASIDVFEEVDLAVGGDDFGLMD